MRYNIIMISNHSISSGYTFQLKIVCLALEDNFILLKGKSVFIKPEMRYATAVFTFPLNFRYSCFYLLKTEEDI